MIFYEKGLKMSIRHVSLSFCISAKWAPYTSWAFQGVCASHLHKIISIFMRGKTLRNDASRATYLTLCRKSFLMSAQLNIGNFQGFLAKYETFCKTVWLWDLIWKGIFEANRVKVKVPSAKCQKCVQKLQKNRSAKSINYHLFEIRPPMGRKAC
jgi:hypothetical protein